MPTELIKEFVGKVCEITLFNEFFGIVGKSVSIVHNRVVCVGGNSVFDYKKSPYVIAHEKVIEIINKYLLYTYELQEYLENCLVSEDEINMIVE